MIATYYIIYRSLLVGLSAGAMRRFGVLGLRGPEPGMAEASSAPKSLKASRSLECHCLEGF